MALDAAHRARADWADMAPAERARLLNRVADRLEENLDMLALAETVVNGKPIRETRNADLPLAIDHFRYSAGCIRAEEGSISTIDARTIAHHFREPLGVVGQIIPWNFPLLMAAWKLAPALAAGNCVVIKPAEQTLMMMAELTADILLPGIVNVVTGRGHIVGRAIADGNQAYPLGRAIEAGRVLTNCYHVYPAHAAFGGYKDSGFGRENHRMMLGHYQQTKNLLVSYDEQPLGLF